MIDWEQLHELRAEVGEDAFSDVVALFMEEVAAILVRLGRADDPTAFEDDLHLLKGTALNLGFAELATLCAEGEARAAHGVIEADRVAALERCYEQSRRIFLDEIAGMRRTVAAQ
ncbi:histidine kinase [Rhodobacteraceae bacterium WD3A24]|nr:histidine kinase [Rhodobacteraceae bacterium WD3A24]